MQKSSHPNVSAVVKGLHNPLTPSPSWPPVAMQGLVVSGPSVTHQSSFYNGANSSINSAATQRHLSREGSVFIEQLELPVDTRKRELLEARFVNDKVYNYHSGLVHDVQSNSSHGITLQPNSGGQTDELIAHCVTPENPKTTPSSSGKKRKRRPPRDAGLNGFDASSHHENNCKKISDYLKYPLPGKGCATSLTGFSQLDVGDCSAVSASACMLLTSSHNVHAQTDLNFLEIEAMEVKAATDSSRKDTMISSMEVERDDLRKELAANQKAIEKNKDMAQKCKNVTKILLIEKSNLEKKTARQKCMENRLRLGQFVTQRQGASFVENWVDGFAFDDLNKKLERISQEREDIERQRKLLSKRKPSTVSGSSKPLKPTKENDGFVKPADRPLTTCEFYEQDEILKLRAASLKKEESDIQTEMEKLDQERHLHKRELIRIHNEDTSRFKQHEVLNERYLLLNLIGKGFFSEVHKGFDLQEQRYVACKIHQLNQDWKEDKKNNYIKHAVREYDIHKQLIHPRIVRLYDVFEINQTFCTVLEYCDGNDLDFYLKQSKSMSEKEARSIIVQMVSALKYLNEIKPPVIHYDLKPGNVLLGSGSGTVEIKITDFGLSKVMEGDGCNLEHEMVLTSQGADTYSYLPPECFMVGKELPKISSKVDVWSLGVIFYQCIYGKMPFGNNLSQASIVKDNKVLKATDLQFPSKPQISNEAKNFIRRCLTYSKDLRPNVLTLAQDDYLRPQVLKSKKSADDAAIQIST